MKFGTFTLNGRSTLLLVAVCSLVSVRLPADPAQAQSVGGDSTGQKKPRGEHSGFFDDSMKSGGLVQGMDLGLPKRSNDGYGEGTGNPAVGPLFGGVNGLNGESTKKAPPPALVPEVETSNGYSVPVRTPRPTPSPSPSPTPTATPNLSENQPPNGTAPGPEYLKQVLEQARDPKKARPRPPAAASQEIPTPKPQSYTF